MSDALAQAAVVLVVVIVLAAVVGVVRTVLGWLPPDGPSDEQLARAARRHAADQQSRGSV